MLRLTPITLLFCVVVGCCFIPSQSNPPRYLEGLCVEFRELKNVVPINKLIAITEHHSKFDASFRRGMKFLQSMKFAELAREIERSSFFQSVLRQFEKAGINVSDIATIRNIINCLMLRASNGRPQSQHASAFNINNYDDDYEDENEYENEYEDEDENEKEDENENENEDENDDDSDYEEQMTSRSLQSFASDILKAIPKQRFSQVVRKEVRKNSEFREFYKIMRSSDFQKNFIKGLSHKSVSRAVRKLRSEGIDVRKLMKTVFQIFLLGPVIV